MYNTVDYIPRADISSVLMDAVEQEKQYVGHEIFPIYPSPNESGRYPRFTIGKSELLKAGESLVGTTKRNETGAYNEIERQFEWDSYMTEEYGLTERVDDKIAARMANFFDAEMITSKALMNNLMLDYEMECAAAAFDPNAFTTTNASVPYTAANRDTMDVPADLNALVERNTLLGESGTVIVMSLPVWNRIRSSKNMQLYMYGYLNVNQGGSQVTEDMVANVFGGVRIIIAKKSVDIAPKGQGQNLQPVWGNDFIGVFNVGDGDFMNGGIGRTITWAADNPGGLFTTEQYRDEPRRSSIVRIRSNRVIKIIKPLSGQLIRTNFS